MLYPPTLAKIGTEPPSVSPLVKIFRTHFVKLLETNILRNPLLWAARPTDGDARVLVVADAGDAILGPRTRDDVCVAGHGAEACDGGDDCRSFVCAFGLPVDDCC